MSRYDGLIIPRSYSEYINKTDAATLSQALQLGGVLDSAPTEDSVKAVKSGGVYDALAALETPVGTIIAQYKKSAPAGYLYLDGSTFDAAEYPSLYAYLGNSNTLPDYREYALVGAEQNNTDTIADHDVYTQGQGKDDQVQNHSHSIYLNTTKLEYTQTTAPEGTNMGGMKSASRDNYSASVIFDGRHGTVTRGKRKAVFYYIKAVSIADIL